ncbi:hypothetical protein [Phaeobacter sp. JH20_39]|uniref:hypothetical protein n=1 Tax=Phaeobacter sp. JH20_39 TaxID=3112496 RepID=UPI003A8857B6
MKTLEERESPFEYSISDKPRTMTAPWLIQYDGQPMPIDIPAGAKALFDKKRQILHVHDNATGISITATPQVFVRLDYTQDFHDIEFVDLENLHIKLCGLYVNEGALQFEDNKVFEFSNIEMFRSACRLLSSPVFNPWQGYPELTPDRCYHMGNFETGELWIHPNQLAENPDTPVDETRGFLVKFLFRTNVPVPGWDRFDKKDVEIQPGLYSAEVIKSDEKTGEPITVKATGEEDGLMEFYEIFVPFDALETFRQAGDLEMGDALYRTHFDPRAHTDLALQAVQPPSKGLLGRLLGK